MVNIPESEWQSVVTGAEAFGFVARISDPVEFAGRSRVLLMRHVGMGIDIDMMLGALPFEIDAIENGRITKLAGISIRLPRVEDLLIMKAIAIWRISKA